MARYSDEVCNDSDCQGIDEDGYHIHAFSSSFEGYRWNEFFTPSHYGPGVWEDRLRLGRLAGLSLGIVNRGTSAPGMWFEPDDVRFCAYADGGGYLYRPALTCMTNVEEGDWLVGWAALRFVCHFYGFEPPADQLEGEPFKPDQGLLVDTVMRQLQDPKGTLDSWSVSVQPGILGSSGYSTAFGRSKEFWDALRTAHERAGLPTL